MIEEFDMPELDDYQLRLVKSVKELIDNNFYKRPPHVKILDAGCDTSGKQLRHFANMTTGQVVGINVAEDFPAETSQNHGRNNITLMNMDGMNLAFPDRSFDMVISANVMEHVSNPAKYINECCRVLKRTGIAYFETAPLWTSARGHHVHEDMVEENCPDELSYRNDGSVIPDWSHLTLNENEMRVELQGKLLPATCDYILWYVYQSGDLNKCTWREIKVSLEQEFRHTSLNTWVMNDPVLIRNPESEIVDSDVFGFSAVCRKKRESALSKRLIWRIRRLGF